MKMAALLLGLLLCSVGVASAGTYNLQYNGAEGNSLGGEYTYPYDFSIDQSQQTYYLFCDSFNREITSGQQWAASALAVTNLNATNVLTLEYPSVGVTGYLEATYLFNQAVAAFNGGNGLAAGELNWAVWDLMMNSDVSKNYLTAGQEASVQSYLSAVMAMGSSLRPSQFAGDVIYTPLDQSSGGPQEFFGFDTPVLSEPSTLSVLGTGLFGFGLMLRRKLAMAKA